MNTIYKPLAVCVVAATLAACASQPKDVELNEQFWQDHTQTVAVAESTKPEAHLEKTGNQGLIDYAINSAMTSTFENHINGTDLSWMETYQASLVSELEGHYIKAVIVKTPIDITALPQSKQDNKKYAVKTYAPLSMKVGDDKLLVITLNKIGAIRNYYGFIPSGAPSAIVDMTGRLVDINSNEIYWRHNARVVTSINGNWDQPPHYDNFNSALEIAVDTAKDELRSSLLNNA